MKYGIENNLVNAPLSLILSILLFFGFFVLGNFLIRALNLNILLKNISNLYFQSPIIGIGFLSIFFYPIILFGFFNSLFIKLVAFFFIIIGFRIFFIFKYNFFKIQKYNLILALYILLIIGYFLLSLTPTTSADSLDYHSTVAMHILNFNNFPNDLEWFHARAAGPGETLIALGYSIGADQIGAMIQFSGILSIVGIILKLSDFYKIKKNTYFFLIMFLSAPVLVFLSSTNKPQLVNVGFTTIALTLIFFKKKFRLKEDLLLITFGLSLLALAVISKYSFALSASLIGLLYLRYSIINKIKVYFLLISVIVFSIIYLPSFIWKFNNFGGDLFSSMFLALPVNLYGYNSFMQSISSCGYNCVPTWIFYPRNLQELTNFLGIGSILFFLIKIKRSDQNILLIFILLYFVIGLRFGQNNARFFIEPYIWTILFLIYSKFEFNSGRINKLISYLLIIQSILVIFVIWTGIINLLPGSLSKSGYVRVMKQYSNGYNLFDWSNSKLESDAVLLTSHRSISISKVKTISLFFINYIDLQDLRALAYFNSIKKKNPTHILVYEDNEKFLKDFKNCIGDLVFFEKNIGSMSTRNPFSSDPKKYNGYIYKFNNNNFPQCLY